MASNYETFWQGDRYAVVGHGAKKPFPVLTYRGLKKLGKTVYPVDPEADQIEGDATVSALDALPEAVDGVVLEVPKEETTEWVQRAVDAGIRDLWIHMNSETPEALELAKNAGINVRSGTCAVMYVTPGFTFHSLHKWARKMGGRY